MNRPRIVHIVGNLETGGMQMLLAQFLRRADHDRFEHQVIQLREPNHFADLFADGRIALYQSPATRRYRRSEIAALAQLLQRLSPAVVHAHSDHAFFAARPAAAIAGVRAVIAHYHNTYHHRLGPAFRQMEALCRPYTSLYLACSEGVRRFIETEIPTGGRPVETATNGIDLAPFRQAATRRDLLRAERGIAAETFHIIHTARLEPHKQPGLLLDAVTTLHRDGRLPRPWRLTFVGGGSLQEKLQAEAQERGLTEQVQFAGWSNNIPGWLATADAYVLASANEGFGLTLLEAMATSVPSIGPDIVGPRDIVRHDHDGLLIPTDSAGPLTEALARIAMDRPLRERLIAEGLSTAQRFRIENYVSQIEEIHQRAVDGAYPPASPLGQLASLPFLWRYSRLAKQSRHDRR